MMTAINPVIYNFEDELEKALAAHAVYWGLNNPRRQQDTDGLKTPRVEFKCIWGGFGTVEHYYINQVTKEKFLDYGQGTTFCKVVTRRGPLSQNHALIRGVVRWMMQDVKGISARMPWHQIVKLLEGNSVPDFKQDEVHDISALSFATTLAIRPTGFTALTPASTVPRGGFLLDVAGNPIYGPGADGIGGV